MKVLAFSEQLGNDFTSRLNRVAESPCIVHFDTRISRQTFHLIRLISRPTSDEITCSFTSAASFYTAPLPCPVLRVQSSYKARLTVKRLGLYDIQCTYSMLSIDARFQRVISGSAWIDATLNIHPRQKWLAHPDNHNNSHWIGCWLSDGTT
jgi:hypothetical protein